MTDERRIVIVGAGQAAAAAAARLRALGHAGPLTVLGDEGVAPYQRPPLSKGYLLGTMPLDRLTLRGPDWWIEAGIALHVARPATAIDRTARAVRTADGALHPYDSLILATGAAARRLPAVMGGDLPGVHVVRTLADIDGLRPALAPGRRLVVIGGGYVGLETAAVARRLGLAVTVVEAAPRILARVAVPQTAALVRALHAAEGVTILEGTALSAITGDAAAAGVRLTDGRHLPADLIVVGIGALPCTDLAEAAGLTLDNGIACDAFGRTSDPAIWAAGDCASIPLPDGGRLRLESVGGAIDMAEAAAANILGAGRPWTPQPWFWSDQYDAKLQIAGLATGADHSVLRPGPTPGAGSVWSWRGERLVAVDALNDPRAYMVGKRLIDSGRSPTPDAVGTAADPKALL